MLELLKIFHFFDLFTSMGATFSLPLLLMNLNYVGIFVGSLLAFLLGYLWYSPSLFGTAWMKALDKNLRDFRGKSPAPALIITACYHLVLAALLACFAVLALELKSSSIFVFLCVLLGILSASGMLMATLYQQNPIRLWFINAGYEMLCMLLMASTLWFMTF